MNNPCSNTYMLLLVLFYALPSHGHPSLTPHTNNPNTIKWELGAVVDEDRDGDNAHNHIAAQSFGGINERGRIYSAVGCWDNREYRDDRMGVFENGHCFIDESNASNVVRYQLPSEMPQGAKDRLRDAFDAWSEVHNGLEFREASPPDFTIRWAAHNFAGEWIGRDEVLIFDSRSRDWTFQKSKTGVPDQKWHFYTLALHEVGHVVGFAHVLGGGLMNDWAGARRPVAPGGPKIDGGVHWDEVDISSIIGVKELYGHPPPAPPGVASWYPWFEWLGCHECSCSDYDIGFTATGASSFDLEFSTNGTSFTPYGLDSTYSSQGYTRSLVHGSSDSLYWRVRGVNSGGDGPWSSIRITQGECDCGAVGGPGGGPREPP